MQSFIPIAKYPTPIQLSYLVEICFQEQEIKYFPEACLVLYTTQKYSSLTLLFH